MSRTSHHHRRTASRRALRREVPSTVALLADREDFAVMRGYPSFAFDDHGEYLQRMQEVMRSLTAQGVHVTVTLFDPAEYVHYCEDTGQDPDAAATRTRYTAEVAALGAAVTYTGQPVEHLVTQLTTAAGRRATWERAAQLLAWDSGFERRKRCDGEVGPGTGEGTGPGGGETHAAFERASLALMRLLESVGAGVHHIVCSIPTDEQPLIGVLHAECDEQGTVRLAESEALVFCTVLAAGIAIGSPGGLVMRTSAAVGSPAAPDRVRGWSLRGGWPHPLTEAEVFNAYCTDAETGEPVPPEPGVVYCPGTPLTPHTP